MCPYHASRDVLNEGAALVFVTYSQLLDPPVRSANGLDDLMKGAVLVFDEVMSKLCCHDIGCVVVAKELELHFRFFEKAAAQATCQVLTCATAIDPGCYSGMRHDSRRTKCCCLVATVKSEI